MKNNRIIILTSVLLSSCATVGKDFPSRKNIELEVTNIDTVKAIYGEPYSKTKDSSKSLETQLYHYYYYNRRTNNHKTLSVEFLDDRVHGYIFSLNWPGETTDFDLNQKTAVIRGKTTKAEVIAIFGEPAGMMELPTHLFGLTAQQMMQQKGAIKCIRYEYAHMNADIGSGILYTKYVTFYIDNRDRVIDFVVTNTFP